MPESVHIEGRPVCVAWELAPEGEADDSIMAGERERERNREALPSGVRAECAGEAAPERQERPEGIGRRDFRREKSTEFTRL